MIHLKNKEPCYPLVFALKDIMIELV